MDVPVFRRGIGVYANPDVIYRQRSSNQNDESTSIPSEDSPYRASTPLYPGTSGPTINNSQRDTGEGEPSRPFHEIITHDETEEMDKGDFQRLMEEWLN